MWNAQPPTAPHARYDLTQWADPCFASACARLHKSTDENHIDATIVAKVCEPNAPSCQCTLDHVPGWPGVGGFTKTRRSHTDQDCVEHPLLLGISGVTFPHQLVCVPNDWMEADDKRVVDAVLGPEVRESVYFHDKEQMVDRSDNFWAVRKHVPYSDHLVKRARALHRRKMDNRPFLAIHLRRGDFLQAHPGLVPSLHEVVKIINWICEDRSLRDVFIATDGTLGRGHGAHGDVEFLQRKVRSTIKVHSVHTGGRDNDIKELHMGELALVEQIVAAGAEYFIGTQSSMFSDLVLQERAVHGSRKETSGLFEAEGDVGYDRPRRANTDGLLRERGYEVPPEHRAAPYVL